MIASPLLAALMRAVLSQDAVTTLWPSGLKPASATMSVCPLRTAMIWPVSIVLRCRLVAGRCDYTLAIWAEAYSRHFTRMPLQNLQTVAGLSIPDPLQFCLRTR